MLVPSYPIIKACKRSNFELLYSVVKNNSTENSKTTDTSWFYDMIDNDMFIVPGGITLCNEKSYNSVTPKGPSCIILDIKEPVNIHAAKYNTVTAAEGEVQIFRLVTGDYMSGQYEDITDTITQTYIKSSSGDDPVWYPWLQNVPAGIIKIVPLYTENGTYCPNFEGLFFESLSMISNKIKSSVKNTILNHKLIQHIVLHESED